MSRIKWRAGFLPSFKNDPSKNRPFDNGSIYHEYSENKPERSRLNKDYDQLLKFKAKKYRKRRLAKMIRMSMIVIGLSILLYMLKGSLF